MTQELVIDLFRFRILIVLGLVNVFTGIPSCTAPLYF